MADHPDGRRPDPSLAPSKARSITPTRQPSRSGEFGFTTTGPGSVVAPDRPGPRCRGPARERARSGPAARRGGVPGRIEGFARDDRSGIHMGPPTPAGRAVDPSDRMPALTANGPARSVPTTAGPSRKSRDGGLTYPFAGRILTIVLRARPISLPMSWPSQNSLRRRRNPLPAPSQKPARSTCAGTNISKRKEMHRPRAAMDVLAGFGASCRGDRRGRCRPPKVLRRPATRPVGPLCQDGGASAGREWPGSPPAFFYLAVRPGHPRLGRLGRA